MDDLVRRSLGGDLAGPSDQTRRAQPTLGGREVRAVEDARAPREISRFSAPLSPASTTIVSSATPSSSERVQQVAEVVIQLGKAVGPVAVAGHALELGARNRRDVQQRVVEVQVERPALADARSRNAIARRLYSTSMSRRRSIVSGSSSSCRTPASRVPSCMYDRRSRSGPVPGVVVPPALVVRARRAVPLVESVVGRPPPVLRPEMPLPQTRGGVSRVREHVGNRPFPCDQPLAAAVSRDGVRPGPDRVAPRHQRRARRRALRLGDVVPQLEALAREVVGPFRLRTADDPAAVAPELAHAEVVDVEEEDVGALRGQLTRPSVTPAAVAGAPGRHRRARRPRARRRADPAPPSPPVAWASASASRRSASHGLRGSSGPWRYVP